MAELGYFSLKKKPNGPEGHFLICSTKTSVSVLSAVIQGLFWGLNTEGSPLTHLPECVQVSGFQVMVTSPLLYSLAGSSLIKIG